MSLDQEYVQEIAIEDSTSSKDAPKPVASLLEEALQSSIGRPASPEPLLSPPPAAHVAPPAKPTRTGPSTRPAPRARQRTQGEHSFPTFMTRAVQPSAPVSAVSKDAYMANAVGIGAGHPLYRHASRESEASDASGTRGSVSDFAFPRAAGSPAKRSRPSVDIDSDFAYESSAGGTPIRAATRPPRHRHRSSSISTLDRSGGFELQRTISGLLTQQSPSSRPSTSLPRFPSGPSFPSLPSLPSIPSIPSIVPQQIRNLSTTAAPETWRTWWEGSNAKGKKKRQDPLLAPEDQGETLQEEQAKIDRKYQSPKNPIVFCHGLLGFDYLGPASLPPLQISHWRGIREVLEQNGSEVLITRVPATSSIQARAEMLMATIEEKFPGREINLIGHSMGGLDGRWLISRLKPTSFKILSLTTISTPHRGSPFADYVIDNIIGRDKLPFWLNLLDSLKLPNGGDGTAFEALGTGHMQQFNEECPDDPDVKYYSWGAYFNPGMLDTFRWPHSIIYEREGPNDGLVSVYSAKHGEYRGTVVGVSHLDLVGWVNHVRFTLSAWVGQEIAFKPATFYLEVADHLAKQGF